MENALALFSRANELAIAIAANPKGTNASLEGPTKLNISTGQVQDLVETSEGLVAQHRGLAILNKLSEKKNEPTDFQTALIHRMDEYATPDLDLNNLVSFPPKMQPVPVKPLFLDVAWNYIQYPQEGKQQAKQHTAESQPKKEEAGGRRGWFGFGR